ncbi:MAG: type II toxin-antitoxin system YoeB family toxin [Duncaniella sp.]|nr:type II toxin-antitoxin system YoeB family toxin [Duncaniella sp.]MDE6061605.1 type II toxin-antitoxin system YoeB family toxin [Duncaniella sp.]MDE6429873.1 type II toxin-antitoxin system YoeB family toxin [Duncaniella sp.]MDE6812246.1 type II toxin-antitoxin system YoeB family toxin [Duncaniella sp.]MDE6824668.1 type II toxin-antitoxin system YoeB family toxin [Duncaniella sp.]
MYTIDFEPKVTKVIAKWKKSNPILYKKLRNVLLAIQENPRQGIGHPEPLIGGGNITYSRHISAHDRIIYDIYDESVHVLVIELEGHYGDK